MVCEGVVFLISGNKETLDLVKPIKTSSNRGLFYENLLFLLTYRYHQIPASVGVVGYFS